MKDPVKQIVGEYNIGRRKEIRRLASFQKKKISLKRQKQKDILNNL
jgi:hypothetical protein